MFDRSILRELAIWSSSGRRRPLVLRGARQVGKTSAVRLFGEGFESFLELNLERSSHRSLFENELSVSDLFAAIRLELGFQADARTTLLFLDEIQASPQAIAALRYFHEDMPELRVIAAGSLLDALLAKQKTSFPVGRVDYLYVFPLTFREYLVAMEEPDALGALDTMPCPAWAHDHLLKLFHEYALVGGMPGVIERYRDERDVPNLAPYYASLMTSYLDDVVKYARNSSAEKVIRHCIEAAPRCAGRRIAFEGFGNSNYRSREVGEALRTLESAQLLYLLYPVTQAELPLLPVSRKRPRLQWVDTGLLNAASNLQSAFYANPDLQDIHRGLVAEHIVGQQLLALEPRRLAKPNFWVREKKQSTAEIDFIIVVDGQIIPIEVKSGAAGSLLSLRRFMDGSKQDLAIRLSSSRQILEEQTTVEGKTYRLLTLPYYLVGQVEAYVRDKA